MVDLLDSLRTITLADVTTDYRQGWDDALMRAAEAMRESGTLLGVVPQEHVADLRARLLAAERERDEAVRERWRLHALVAEARNFIDPEEHADWEEGAFAETLPCDQLVDQLHTARAQRDAAVEALVQIAACPEDIEGADCAFVGLARRDLARACLARLWDWGEGG